MRRFRFRIGSLLILIVLLGVGFAALREADDFWDGIVLALAIGALLVSVLLAIHRQSDGRAFWVGFALLGWGYLGLTTLPSIEPRLLTTRALAYLDCYVLGRSSLMAGQSQMLTVNNSGQMTSSVTYSPQGNILARSNNWGGFRVWSTATGSPLWAGLRTTENFVQIGHSLFALILAWLGGQLSRRLHISSRDSNPASESVEAPGGE
jgi:hypothetical protein